MTTSDNACECKFRLDVAMDSLRLSSSRLKDVIFVGPDEVVETALARLRLARFRFLEARDDYREATRHT
jgi:hypothetical protein